MSGKIIQGPEFKLPVDEGTLGQFFFNCAEKYSDRICQIDGTTGETETYSSAKLRSTRIAIQLQKRGVTFKDVVAVCSANTLDNTISMLAAFYLCAKVANLEPSSTVQQTRPLVRLVAPKIIFVQELAVNLIEESLVGANFESEIIVIGSSDQYTVLSDLTKKSDDEDIFRPLDGNVHDVALISFSSGTTSLPKAICHSSRSFLYLILQGYVAGRLDVVLHLSSFFWITGWLMLFYVFKAGTFRVFCRNSSAEDIFKIIEKYQVTCFVASRLLTYQLTNFENAYKYNTFSLKYVQCGGSPISDAQVKKMNDVFKNACIVTMYGMTEVGMIAFFDPDIHLELMKKKIASCGVLRQGIQLKVVDFGNEELLGPNQRGEIRLKSLSRMVGYYGKNPSEDFDKDGFFKTGDFGYFDEDDCIYVIDRTKDIFKYQSMLIAPSPIEDVLLRHPDIEDVVVFGVPDELNGALPSACVVLKKGIILSEQQIDEFLKNKVSDRERLRGGVAFVQSVKKTPSGKVVRKEMRDKFIDLKK